MSHTRTLTSTALASLCVLACTVAPARATVLHDFLAAPTEEISAAVTTCGTLTGPIDEVSALTVAPGEALGEASHLWFADRAGGARVDELDASTGVCESQLTNATPLGFVQSVAVSDRTGEREVYAGYGDGKNAAIAVFGPLGALQATWDGADTPSGAFGVEEQGSYGFPTSIAIDESINPADWAKGDVLVNIRSGGAGTHAEEKVVDVFSPTSGGGEKYVTRITGPESGVQFSDPRAVAVAPVSGDVLVADGTTVYEFEPQAVVGEYALKSRLTGTPAGPFHELGTVAVDAGDGDFYVVEELDSRVVYQFGAAGEYLGRIAGTSAGSPLDSVGHVAADPATHDVFVAGSHEGKSVIDVFGPNIVVPDVAVAPATEVSATTARLHGTVNPDGEGQATCRFEYGTTTAYGESVGCEVPVPNGSAPVSVSAPLLESLTPDTTYHYRLVASNKNGANAGQGVEDEGQFTTKGPGIDEESAFDVAATSATLEAAIVPHGQPTSYFFQYSTGETSACDATPEACVNDPAAPGTAIGAGEEAVQVSPEQIQGLTPDTLYHYRVVTVSEVEVTPGRIEHHEFTGPDHTFTTQAAHAPLTLPDGRAWELVSQPDLHGALIFSLDGSPTSHVAEIKAADNGEAITYMADAPTETGPKGYANSVQIISSRSPSGWVSRDIAAPHSAATQASIVVGEEYRLFSSDLSLGLLQPYGAFTPSLSSQATEQGPYLRTDFPAGSPARQCAESCYRPLVTGAPGVADVPAGTQFGQPCPRHELAAYFCGPFLEGASPDLRHVVIKSNVALTETGGEGLYEWSATAPPGEALRFIGAGNLGNGTGFRNTDHAISDDGSRVFFSPTRQGLSMYDLAKAETLTISASGEFEDASADGSRVILHDGSSKSELYECDIFEEAGGKLACRRTDLASPLNEAESSGDVGAILGASEDGTYVYFVANSVLASNRGSDGTHAAPGECREQAAGTITCNLYVWHEDPETGESSVTFIATLSQEDSHDWNVSGRGSLEGSTARVSPNGRWVAFMSDRSLTGYDNRDAASGEHDEEVYLYHTPAGTGEAGSLACASCDPTGARPHGVEEPGINSRLLVGHPQWGEGRWLAGSIPSWTTPAHFEANYQSRYLSSSGRLFFNSSDALVPQDVNGSEDVYEYEPPASAEEAPSGDGCSVGSTIYSPVSGGCVDLISSGSSPEESAFLDASENGNDVFFLSSAQLAGQDSETGLKVYDARVCTSESPCPPPPPPPPPVCEGDACQTPVSAPEDPTPGSLTFQGPGNVVPPSPSPTKVKPKAKSLTPAQKLARTLKACRKKPKRQRAGCERRARRADGARKARAHGRTGR